MKKNTKLQPNKIIVVSAAIGITTIILGVILILTPFINKNKTLRSEILEERKRNVLIGKIRGFGRHLKAYEKRIPEKGRGVSWLLSEVVDMAAKENMEVSSVKPGTPEDRGLYIKLYVVMDTISTYDQLGRFISRVESYDKFLLVEQISMKRRDLEKDFNKFSSKYSPFDVKANIVISTIIFKE